MGNLTRWYAQRNAILNAMWFSPFVPFTFLTEPSATTLLFAGGSSSSSSSHRKREYSSFFKWRHFWISRRRYNFLISKAFATILGSLESLSQALSNDPKIVANAVESYSVFLKIKSDVIFKTNCRPPQKDWRHHELHMCQEYQPAMRAIVTTTLTIIKTPKMITKRNHSAKCRRSVYLIRVVVHVLAICCCHCYMPLPVVLRIRLLLLLFGCRLLSYLCRVVCK